jgi:protein-arginine kinase activator protein McsA
VKEKTKEEIIAEKQAEMQKAVESQNFEQAAIIRDEIKQLKEEN